MRTLLPLPCPLSLRKGLGDYIEVIKPRETSLITFIGVGTAVMAAAGQPPLPRLLLTALAIALGSAGVNGLTNYLDREVDARMERTRRRALPARRIYPAQKALPWVGGLTTLALFLAWLLNPWASLAGFAGTAAALVGRKTAFTHLLGGLSGAAPVAVGWLALNPTPSPTLLFLVLLVLVWVPLHVWSLMLTCQADYLQAGVRVFPLGWPAGDVARVLLLLSFLLYAVSWGGFLLGSFGWLYLIAANLLGVALVLSCFRLVIKGGGPNAWRLYKLVTFPYLGVMFLVMMTDMVV